MRDIDVSISEAQAAYRSVFLVEMLLRLLARKLIAHNRVGVREACERALGRGARHTAPLPVVVDQSLLSTVDELNYCSLGELTRIIFDSDLHKTLDGWVAPADTNQLKIHIQLVQQLRNALAHFWPVRFTPDLTAPLRTLSTVLVTVLAEAGADDPEFQQLKRLQAAEVDLGSSRRLDWARLGIPHPDVISAVAEHMVKPHRENQAIQGLAPFLSHTLQLGPAITFRASTTQMFRAVLECVTLHAIGHSSRPGEEGMFAARMIAPSNRSSPRLGKLVYSDVDHPAMQHTIQAMWRRAGGGVTRVHLADLVCGPGQGDARAAVVRRYLDAVHAGGVSIVLLPHVVWINGAILDVRQICAAIREADPLIVTVIDGAQAVGHLPLEVESSDAENEDVDFYLGCGHKWLGGRKAWGLGGLDDGLRQSARPASPRLLRAMRSATPACSRPDTTARRLRGGSAGSPGDSRRRSGCGARRQAGSRPPIPRFAMQPTTFAPALKRSARSAGPSRRSPCVRAS
jgi:hypothetical protein